MRRLPCKGLNRTKKLMQTAAGVSLSGGMYSLSPLSAVTMRGLVRFWPGWLLAARDAIRQSLLRQTCLACTTLFRGTTLCSCAPTGRVLAARRACPENGDGLSADLLKEGSTNAPRTCQVRRPVAARSA